MRHAEITLVALVFAICHAISPAAFRRVEAVRETVGSFSGGLAAAYVFLHLVPEIGEGGELLGPRIYFVLLVGLAGFYVLEVLVHRRRQRSAASGDAVVQYAAAALYSSLLVFTLGQQLPETAALTAVFAATMGLHLLTADFGYLESLGEDFARRGRWILVGAVGVGFLLSLVRDPHEEVTDIVTALLAGFIVFNVFRKELPDFAEARLLPFLGGMGSFLVAHLLLTAGE